MSDIFRVFKSCFFCHSKKNLLQVVHPAYTTTYNYYHVECLKKVLKDPEKYVFYLDSAIAIQDQLNQDQEKIESRLRHIEQAKARATEIFKSTYEKEETIEKQQPIEPETETLPKTLKIDFIKNKK